MFLNICSLNQVSNFIYMYTCIEVVYYLQSETFLFFIFWKDQLLPDQFQPHTVTTLVSVIFTSRTIIKE